MEHAAGFDAALLSRIEDAGLNASAPPQQVLVDGWLLRHSPGSAKRARCINALAAGRLSMNDKLHRCAMWYRKADLPMLVRITPFTEPADLDEQLAARGFNRIDDTRVMVCDLSAEAPRTDDLPPLSADLRLQQVDADRFADAIGTLRSATPLERAAHAQRLAGASVSGRPFVLHEVEQESAIAACGLFVLEADLVGLYDVFTAPSWRRRGLALALCARLLALARDEGARIAYLQVDHANDAARAVYRRLGFADAYAYHYRAAPSNLTD